MSADEAKALAVIEAFNAAGEEDRRRRSQELRDDIRAVAERAVAAASSSSRSEARVDEAARLRAALESIQWGSCDGCGNHHRCPECHGHRPVPEFDQDPAYMQVGHTTTCTVGRALAGDPGAQSPVAEQCSDCGSGEPVWRWAEALTPPGFTRTRCKSCFDRSGFRPVLEVDPDDLPPAIVERLLNNGGEDRG
jgi:hypothetical protein